VLGLLYQFYRSEKKLTPLSLEQNQEYHFHNQCALSELERSTLMEEVSWRQKSRALWLKEGD